MIKKNKRKKMFLLFHVAIPLIIFELPYIKKNFRVNRFFLIFGSLFPDLVDKPLSILGLFSGRGIAHTLVFVLLSFLVVFILSKGNKAISFPFLIGIAFHLILDAPYVPLFYPFVSYDFSMLEDPIGYWWMVLLTDPLVITTELIGFFIILFVIFRNKLYTFRKIINYLSTNQLNSFKKTNKS